MKLMILNFCLILIEIKGLETCPQANLVQSVHSATTLLTPRISTASERRVTLQEYDSAPSRKYTAHFGPFSPVSVKAATFFSEWIHLCDYTLKIII